MNPVHDPASDAPEPTAPGPPTFELPAFVIRRTAISVSNELLTHSEDMMMGRELSTGLKAWFHEELKIRPDIATWQVALGLIHAPARFPVPLRHIENLTDDELAHLTYTARRYKLEFVRNHEQGQWMGYWATVRARLDRDNIRQGERTMLVAHRLYMECVYQVLRVMRANLTVLKHVLRGRRANANFKPGQFDIYADLYQSQYFALPDKENREETAFLFAELLELKIKRINCKPPARTRPVRVVGQHSNGRPFHPGAVFSASLDTDKSNPSNGNGETLKLEKVTGGPTLERTL
ncbi:uncharacterized protein LOC131877761 isoform X2 [Tigriopus californicus]|uniref:uncharacterized protein LOC131877761 isoform X2 n=1 Tax=Tigriopus californicus TaxID=6832 RepID=UPI0027DA0FA9|nr:uncharacterized protein LOC131877761 isoform X2 [Tigriopus californicus]